MNLSGTVLALGALLLLWLRAGYLCFREDFHIEEDRPAARILLALGGLMLLAALVLTAPDTPGYAWLVGMHGPFAFDLSRLRIALGVFWLAAGLVLESRDGGASKLALPSLVTATGLASILALSLPWQLFWLAAALFARSWLEKSLQSYWRWLVALAWLPPVGLLMLWLHTEAFEVSLNLLSSKQALYFTSLLWVAFACWSWFATRLKREPQVFCLLALGSFAVGWNLVAGQYIDLTVGWLWLGASALLALALALASGLQQERAGLALAVLATGLLAIADPGCLLAAYYLLLTGLVWLVLRLSLREKCLGPLGSVVALLLVVAPLVSFGWWSLALLMKIARAGTTYSPQATLALCVVAFLLAATGWWQGQTESARGLAEKSRRFGLIALICAGVAAIPYGVLWFGAPVAGAFEEIPPWLASIAKQVLLATGPGAFWALLVAGLMPVGYLLGKVWPYSILEDTRDDALAGE